MKRRAFLAGVTGLVSGCAGVTGSQTPTPVRLSSVAVPMKVSDPAVAGETGIGELIAYTVETTTEESVGLATIPLQIRDENETIVDQTAAAPAFVPGDRPYRDWVLYVGSEEIHTVTAGEPELALAADPASISPTVEMAGPPATIAATNDSDDTQTIRLGGALVDDDGTALVTQLEDRTLEPGDRASVEVGLKYERRAEDVAEAVAYAFDSASVSQ